MPSFEDVAAIAAGLPAVTEIARHGDRAWAVTGKVFAWERPLRKADLRRFGDDTPPVGEILAVRVADASEKEAALGAGHRGVFTISHFDGYNGVLIALRTVGSRILRDTLVDAWLAMAPAKLVEDYLSSPEARRR